MASDDGRALRVGPVVVAFALVVGAVWLVTTGGPFRGASTPTPTAPPSVAESTPGPAEPNETTPASARVGFVGLPPEGATPSAPRRGELVLGYFGQQFTHWYQVWVYADGRMIWQREGNLREGANQYSTGFLEQRLSPEGVRILRRRGSAEAALFGFPWRPPYPASWLPPRAWEDVTIRAYVPSAYAVCYQGVLRSIAPTRILAWLPAPAATLLEAADLDPASVDGWIRGFGGGCSRVPTEDARTVAGALEEAGFGVDEEFRAMYALAYYLTPGHTVRNEIAVRFEPILPHGEVGCTSCGEGRLPGVFVPGGAGESRT